MIFLKMIFVVILPVIVVWLMIYSVWFLLFMFRGKLVTLTKTLIKSVAPVYIETNKKNCKD